MEMKETNGTTEVLVSEDDNVALIPLDHYKELVEESVRMKIFRRLWDSEMDGDEFEGIFELVLGPRYLDEEDEDDAE